MLSSKEFKICFDKYFDDLRRFIYYRCSDEELASDLAQEVFMKIWEKREHLNNENLKSLLYKIANDMVISDYRKTVTRLDYTKNIQPDNYDLSPQEEMQFEELKQRYSDALAMMPEKQRLTFLLSRNDELKYHEIAERLEISVKAVEKRMSTALQFLKTKLL